MKSKLKILKDIIYKIELFLVLCLVNFRLNCQNFAKIKKSNV